jgi:hypothetical protein
LDPQLPSAIRVAGIIPTDLTYTADNVHSYLQAIGQSLRAEGFDHIIVNGADQAAVHSSEMVRRARTEHYVDECEPVAALGDEIADLVTLRGFHERGALCATVQVPQFK